jgi:catechol 2,3-dioxygenase-like lactoylglutathione lyase family enzyme
MPTPKPPHKAGLVHHIELYVSDLRRSQEFWGWLLEELGYAEHQRWAEGVSWRLGPTYLVRRSGSSFLRTR